MNLNSFKSLNTQFNHRDLLIFILPVLIFGFIYLFAFNPGVLTIASYSQLHQIAADKLTAAYPVFYTYLVMISLKFTNSIFLLGIIQILIFSSIWTLICKYHRDDSSKSSNEFTIQFIITTIICLIPINAIYSITLSSNILFSYSILFLCFLIKVMIDTDGQINLNFSILLGITLAIMSGLNNYGIIIALISLIVILYYLYRKNTTENKLITLVGLTIICMLFVGSLNLIYDVKGSDYDAYTQNYNIPMNDAFDDGINLEGARNEFLSSTNSEPIKSYENTISLNTEGFNYNLLDSFANLFRNSFILGGLFDNPIVYLALSIVLLALINFITPSEEIYLLYLPPFLNIIINFFTGQNNIYSNLLVFYLILIIFISICFKLNLTPKSFTKITQTIPMKNEVKTPTITKQENKTETISEQSQIETNMIEDNYYPILESEIEELTQRDIDEMLTQPTEHEQETNSTHEGESDLIDEILKEIEMGKK